MNFHNSGLARRVAELTMRLRKFDVAARFHAAIGFLEHLRPFWDACRYCFTNWCSGILIMTYLEKHCENE
jgi:hypothetical protein